MKAYLCDSCRHPISDPHFIKMKLFYLATDYDTGGAHPIRTTRKEKIHLCDVCFKNLRYLRKEEKND